MCEGFYYSEHLFHLACVEEAKERKRGNFLTFPGFPAAHMRRSSVGDSAFCFINVVVHNDTYHAKKTR